MRMNLRNTCRIFPDFVGLLIQSSIGKRGTAYKFIARLKGVLIMKGTKVVGMVLIFICLLMISCRQEKINQDKFKDVYRAARTVGALTGIGVNYQEFQEAIHKLAIEVIIAQDMDSSDAEKELVSLFAQALATYKDSQKIWSSKIEKSQEDFIPGYIFIRRDMKEIVEKYSLPIKENKFSEYYKYIPEESIQMIWLLAEAYVDKAVKLYYGEPIDSTTALKG